MGWLLKTTFKIRYFNVYFNLIPSVNGFVMEKERFKCKDCCKFNGQFGRNLFLAIIVKLTLLIIFF